MTKNATSTARINDSERTKSAAAITRDLESAERSLREARTSIQKAIKFIEAHENEPELKTPTMKALIGSLDIASTPLGMEVTAWNQNTAARRFTQN